ncbi:MAG TPA: NlpC/P60 family protein [Propionibacteriaceae bacterium]|nr:NlpC/P60 family protein [Propionibacteriaceae bacterium]
MIALVRGGRAAGGAAALVLGLTGLGLVVGPAAAADSVMTATTTVNVRAGASTGTPVLGVLQAGTSVTATGPSTNGWTKISFNGRVAYVSTSYLKSAAATTSATVASVTSMSATTLEAVNVRTGPDIASSVWTVLPKGQTITVTGVTQNGYHQLTDGHWVSSAWITVTSTLAISVASPKPSPTAAPTTATPTASPTTSAPTKAPTTTTPVVLPPVTGQVRATAALMIRTTSDSDFVSLGDVPAGTILNVTGVVTNGVAQIVYEGAVRWVNANYIVPVTAVGPVSNAASVIVNFALSQVGKAYVWGGNGPTAYDCSGLTVAAYRAAGISIPRTTYQQWTVGVPVSLANLQPGDLVFYYSGISHVGIYIGNGRIVHAANPTSGVTTASVTSMPFQGGRRVV